MKAPGELGAFSFLKLGRQERHSELGLGIAGSARVVSIKIKMSLDGLTLDNWKGRNHPKDKK